MRIPNNDLVSDSSLSPLRTDTPWSGYGTTTAKFHACKLSTSPSAQSDARLNEKEVEYLFDSRTRASDVEALHLKTDRPSREELLLIQVSQWQRMYIFSLRGAVTFAVLLDSNVPSFQPWFRYGAAGFISTILLRECTNTWSNPVVSMRMKMWAIIITALTFPLPWVCRWPYIREFFVMVHGLAYVFDMVWWTYENFHTGALLPPDLIFAG